LEELRILAPDLENAGELALFTSLQITRRHYGTGEFELHAPDSLPGARALAIGRLIVPTDEPRKAMIIETLVYDEAKGEVTAKGCTLDGLTKRRLAVPPPSADGTFGWDRIIGDAETVFKHFAAHNLAAPSDPKRAMPRVTIGHNQKRGMESVAWQARFEALDALLKGLAEYTDMGWDILLDPVLKRFVFDVIPGRDLQAGNTEGTYASIAPGMGNAETMTHTVDTASLRNVAYVGGQGEDERRLILAAGDENAGLERREVWVDGGSLDLPQELLDAGRRKLNQTPAKNILQTKVLQQGVFQYGRDYDLGDRVTLQAATGRLDARLIEIREVYEAGKPVQLGAVFGEAPVSLSGVLREMQNTIAR
jgi:hypothetical protein